MIIQYLEKRGFSTPSANLYAQVGLYLSWYKGNVEDFHKYSVFNGTSRVGVNRYTLGMAKVIAEDHANLLLNEKVKINVSGAFDKRLQEILAQNNFRVQGNNLVELAYALGTGAFVEYKGFNGMPTIDYIRADMIYPLSWDNDNITECAFASVKQNGGSKIFYIQLHILDARGKYVIENVFLNAKTGEVTFPPKDICPIVETGSSLPLFQIIKPNIVNNQDLDSPMGMSIYGNSIDQLKGADLIWDSYMNEFTLGRKRVLVPMSMAKIEMTKDGTASPIFDPRDTVFYAIETPQDGKQEITEINMSIRAAEHELGLQRCLNILSKKCGLGNDRYKFENGGVKTATEVISEKSELFQNLKKNELLIEGALTNLTKALAFLSGITTPVEVNIAFDDSIIEDHNSQVDEHIKLTGAGLESKITAIMDIKKCSEKDAQKELDKINSEQMLDGILVPDEGEENDTGTA